MPGLYFELFICLTFLIAGLMVAGAAWRKSWPLIVAAIFMILTGAVLMSDGLRVEVGSTFNINTGVLTYDYNALLPSNDYTVNVFANSYFYGGFVLVIIAAGLLVWRRIGGVEE